MEIRRYQENQPFSNGGDLRAEWADLVAAHLINGPDIVDGLQAGWSDVGRIGGVILAQMSSRGNLGPGPTGSGRETKRTFGVFGFIGNGSRPEN